MKILNRIGTLLNHPLNRDRKIKALIGYLKWQAGIRLVPGDIIFNWMAGSRFIVGKGEATLTGNVYCGLAEFTDMGFLLHALRSDDLFVDVGANLGSYTILACAAVGARGIAFEPVPFSYARLRANVRLNVMEERVSVLNMAIGEASGELPFTSGHGALNHVIAPGDTGPADIVVEVRTLDDVLKDADPVIMKIDVEGYETAVLQAADETLGKETLLAVIIELDGHGARYGYDEAKIVDRMRGFGFQPYGYDPFTRSLTALDGQNAEILNTLFIRDKEAVLERLRSGDAIEVFGRRI